MPKKENKKEESEDIKIKKEKSSLAEFIERPLPTDEEIEEFEDIINEEAKDEEIEESLAEIYQDDDGDMVDVSKMSIKKKRGFFFYFFSFLTFLLVVSSLAYAVYFFYMQNDLSSSAIKIDVEGPEKVSAGEEFFYKVNLENPGNVNLKNVKIDLDFPDNFVRLESFPESQENSDSWYFDSLVARTTSSIKVKGKIIDEEDSEEILFATAYYTPENFSSEFKKEDSFVTQLNNIGLDFDFTYSSVALVGEENEILINFQPREDNFINDFIIEAQESDNLEFLDYKEDENEEESAKVEKIGENQWMVSEILPKEEELSLKYKIKDKSADMQEMVFQFKQVVNKEDEEVDYVFYEEKFEVEVMNSDLNLVLEINDSKGDFGVDFGEKLDYVISYKNKGESTMKDVVIMAILKSDFLDWTTLSDPYGGIEKGNTIIWSKAEIPELEEVEYNEEGEIKFSINVLPFRESDLGKDYKIESYVQFSVGEKDEVAEDTENKSNAIVNLLNSDLSLDEEIRYFNSDNIPVGSGPLPPKVGENTDFKVYWNITNNIHELNGTKVETSLPANVFWVGKERTSVGSVYYDSENHKIIWDIGRMPVSVYRADAEFSVGVNPGEEDRNKIMVLLSGSQVSAKDIETEEDLVIKTQPKTTKLEDDEIAQMSNDGIVD